MLIKQENSQDTSMPSLTSNTSSPSGTPTPTVCIDDAGTNGFCSDANAYEQELDQSRNLPKDAQIHMPEVIERGSYDKSTSDNYTVAAQRLEHTQHNGGHALYTEIKAAQQDDDRRVGATTGVGAQDDDDDDITILHFNDCYNVEPGPQSSGAAGFLTAIKQYKHLEPMILFSGDIISPSFMSTFTKGEQMIPVLNDIGVHCAVFGNHEFDYGVDNLCDFVKRTTFPWLLSNVIDKETSSQLGDGKVYHILERNGFKFGLIGLIEEEWLSILATLDPDDVIYQDFVERGQELARWLKGEPHQVDYVIALTHFRRPNDQRLADSVPEIDLILGGHDHDYEIFDGKYARVIKSGTDFREFSRITLKVNKDYEKQSQHNGNRATLAAEKPFKDMKIERVDCEHCKPDVELERKLAKFVSQIDEKMSKVLGQLNCELDGRFSSIRKFETNLGNFVTDIMLASTHADVAILNSGTLRSDRVHPKGDFTMRDLFSILGFIDPIAVLEASGRHILRALENGVSQWPKLEGRFPQVSGCTFVFDPSKPPMSRIDPKDVTIGDEPLVLNKLYKLTTKEYLALGKDGYDMLKECTVLVPGDESPDLTTSILNHFEAITIIKSNRRTHHRQSIISVSRASLKKMLSHQNSQASSQYTTTTTTTSTTTTSTSPLCLPDNSNSDTNNNDDNAEDNNNNAEDSQRDEARDAFDDTMSLHTATPSSPYALSSAHSGRSSGGRSHSTDTPRTTSPLLEFVPRTKRHMSIYEIETEQCKLEPKVEGRIRVVGVHVH